MATSMSISGDIARTLSGIEHDIGLPEGILVKILYEEDWSFVIKLHAMFEAAVTQLLVTTFGDNELEDVFSNLEFADSKKGKLCFVKRKGLLRHDAIKFLRALSEIRNSYVHNIKNTVLAIGDFIRKLDKDKRTNIVNPVVRMMSEFTPAIENEQLNELLLSVPKNIFWIIAVPLLVEICVKKKAAIKYYDETKRNEDFVKTFLGSIKTAGDH